MKKFLLATLLMLCTSFAHATPIMLDPNSGLSGSFYFGGTPGSFQTNPVDGWEITLSSDGYIDITLDDCCVIGDEFALVVDGVIVPWDVSNPGSGTLFSASINDLFLSAGTHTFAFMLTAACCSSGGGSYSFSSVPTPPSIALFMMALLGLSLSRKKFLN